MDNYWSTVVVAVVVAVVTVSAAVLPDAGWRNAAAAVLARVCSQRAAWDWAAPDIGQHSAVRGGRAKQEQ